MNKKQNLVNEIINRMEKAHVNFGSDVVRCQSGYWDKYPDGNCDIDPVTLEVNSCIESTLACLSVSSLERIAENDLIEEGMQVPKLWRVWGQAGYFKMDPEIFMIGRTPVFKFRHDCFLAPWRDSGFQNSYDAYYNGSNGSSSMDIQRALRAIEIPEHHSSFFDVSGEERPNDVVIREWNQKWALFRKAMFVSYPIEACSGKSAFHQTLKAHSKVFSDYVDAVGSDYFHLGLDSELTWSKMIEQASRVDVLNRPAVEKSLIEESKFPEVFGTMKFGRNFVSFTWNDGEPKSLAIEFPEWERNAWNTEATFLDLGCDHPQMLPESDYYCTCWLRLSIVLLAMAGVACAIFYMKKASNMRTIPPLFEKDSFVHDINSLSAAVFDASSDLMTFNELADALCELTM